MQYRTLGRTGVHVGTLAQLAAGNTVPCPEVLDAVDEIVTPGLDLAPEERTVTPPSLFDPSLRRRR